MNLSKCKLPFSRVLLALTLLVASVSCQSEDPCVPTFCEKKGTTCEKAWGLDVHNQQLDQVTSHHCYLPDGTDGESLYCCDRGSEEGEIIEKLAPLPNEFPSQAFLTMEGHVPGAGGNCGGTVYNRNWIITAAHCVTNHTATSQKAKKATAILAANHVLGEHDPEKVYTSTGKNIIIHPKYNKQSKKIIWDVALLKLDRPISKKVWGTYVKALRIAKEGEIPQGNRSIAIGYGKSDLNKTLGALAGGPLPLSLPGDADCDQVANRGEYSAQNICVGGKGAGSVSSGDSGGPAICYDSESKPYLCGIASYVSGECVTQIGGKCPKLKPGVFVSVAYFNKWFTDNIKESQEKKSLITKLGRDMYTGKWIKGKTFSRVPYSQRNSRRARRSLY